MRRNKRGIFRCDTYKNQAGGSRFMINKMKYFDLFSQPMPSFNVRGEEFLRTKTGAFMTMLLMTSMLIYALLKFIQMQDRQNPNIEEHVERVTFDQNNVVNLTEMGFRAAFAMRGFNIAKQVYEFKNDPAYVKYLVKERIQTEFDQFWRVIPHRPCTEDDMKNFYPIQDDQSGYLDSILQDSSSGFICIDWERDDPYITYGKEHLPNFRGIEVIATPCNFIKSYLSGENEVIADQCELDPEKQFNYLGSALYLTVLHNTERLNFNEYGDEFLVKESTIHETQFQPRVPSWQVLEIQMHEHEDETSFWQFGQQEMTQFFQLNAKQPSVSGWTDNLIENPEGFYKFASLMIWPSNDMIKSSRQTYAVLDWLGDIGGLNDALFIMIELTMIPFKRFTFGSFILTRLFRVRKKQQNSNKSTAQSKAMKDLTEYELESLKKTFGYTKSINEMKYLSYALCCFSSKKERQEYRQKMIQSADQVTKEMDLKKQIMRSRMQTIARLCLLSGRQIYLGVKMAQPIVHDTSDQQSTMKSSDSLSCSSHDQPSIVQKKQQFVDRMARKFVNSGDVIDQRILSLYRTRDTLLQTVHRSKGFNSLRRRYIEQKSLNSEQYDSLLKKNSKSLLIPSTEIVQRHQTLQLPSQFSLNEMPDGQPENSNFFDAEIDDNEMFDIVKDSDNIDIQRNNSANVASAKFEEQKNQQKYEQVSQSNSVAIGDKKKKFKSVEMNSLDIELACVEQMLQKSIKRQE